MWGDCGRHNTVSIITPVYNRVRYIGDTLSSVATQSWPCIEHIVIDGGSTDGTLDVVRACASVDKFISESDDGIYDALNKGLGWVSGDIVGILHSDDIFFENSVIERVVNVLYDNDIDGVYGDLVYMDKNMARVVRRWKAGEYRRSRLAWGWMPPHPTLFLRRLVIERWGGYDTRYRIAGDYDAMLRYLARGGVRLAYLPEVLVKMRVGGESNRSLSRILRKSREDYCALRENGVGGLGTLLAKNLRKVGQFL